MALLEIAGVPVLLSVDAQYVQKSESSMEIRTGIASGTQLKALTSATPPEPKSGHGLHKLGNANPNPDVASMSWGMQIQIWTWPP